MDGFRASATSPRPDPIYSVAQTAPCAKWRRLSPGALRWVLGGAAAAACAVIGAKAVRCKQTERGVWRSIEIGGGGGGDGNAQAMDVLINSPEAMDVLINSPEVQQLVAQLSEYHEQKNQWRRM